MSDYEPPYGNQPEGPPPFQPAPPGPPAMLEPRPSGKAIASIILGVMGVVFWIFTGLPAIVLALVAKSDIRTDPQRYRGDGLANLGLAIGVLSLFVPFIVWPYMIDSYVSVGPDYEVADDTERVVHFHLSGPMLETPSGNMPGLFAVSAISLKEIVQAIEVAAADESVLALLLTVEMPSISQGQIEEIWTALEGFKETGRDVYVHASGMQTGAYALVSAATHLNIVPTDSLWLTGMYASGLYLKDALDKIGVESDMLHMGDYKSAGEMFARNGPTPEAEENMNWLLDGLYEGLVDMIATSRDWTHDEVMGKIDDGPYTAQAALDAGLIDSVLHKDAFIDEIEEAFGEDVYIDNYYDYNGYRDTSPPGFFELMSGAQRTPSYEDNTIAIVYVEGAIVQGYEGSGMFGGSIGAFSGTIVRRLEHAAENDAIKAVVLRVDSPGGSVVASEEILRATRLLADEKPLVISMGNTAASGGYYVACAANAIFADANTVTASIGVVGGKLVTGGLWEELGITWHGYKRGENADLLDSTKPFSESQRAHMREYMEDAYTTFKKHVTDARGDKLTKDIEDLAGGRVFTGRQALDLGLVDQIGGLSDAVTHAADLASLEDYDVRVIPEPKDFFEAFMESFSGTGGRPTDLRFSLLARLLGAGGSQPVTGAMSAEMQSVSVLGQLFPGQLQAVSQVLATADLLQRERVVVMMPQVMTIE